MNRISGNLGAKDSLSIGSDLGFSFASVSLFAFLGEQSQYFLLAIRDIERGPRSLA